MIITYIIGGAAMAGGGWLFHRMFGNGTRKSNAREIATFKASLARLRK